MNFIMFWHEDYMIVVFWVTLAIEFLNLCQRRRRRLHDCANWKRYYLGRQGQKVATVFCSLKSNSRNVVIEGFGASGHDANELVDPIFLNT